MKKSGKLFFKCFVLFPALLVLLCAGEAHAKKHRKQAGQENAASMPQNVGPNRAIYDSVLSSLHNHPLIKSFQEYREAAQHEVGKARSGWFPRLDARVGYGTNVYSSPNSRIMDRDKDWHQRFESQLILTQTIWDGFATSSRVDINTAKLNSANSRLFDNSESIALDATLAHIEVLRQYQLLSLAEDNVKTHERILGSQKERVASGVDTAADISQTQGRLAQAVTTVANTRNDLDVALSNYKKVTGLEAANLLQPQYPVAAPKSYQDAVMQAQTSNPKILAYSSDIKAADSSIQLAKSAFWPVISGELAGTYLDGVDDSFDWNRGFRAVLRADWNIFNGLYDYYNVKSAYSSSRQSRADYTVVYDQLAQDVRDTWNRLEASRELVRFYSKAVDYNKQTTAMYWEQFNIGQRSLLDVLNSENELFSNRLQLVTADMNVVGAAYRLLALEGKLIESLGIPQSDFEKKQIDAPINLKDSPVSQVNPVSQPVVSPDVNPAPLPEPRF